MDSMRRTRKGPQSQGASRMIESNLAPPGVAIAPSSGILHLQRLIGNRAVGLLLAGGQGPRPQADGSEREAAAAEGSGPAARAVLSRDWSGVRLHTGETAARLSRELQARAFTVGDDIVFGAGQFQPETEAGKRLLAHELTHVAQQRVSGHRLQRAPDDEPESPNPIAGWVHPTGSLLVVQADDRLFILPAANLVWVPDAASVAATPHIATDLGPLFETPATGASGTRVFRAGRQAALILDAGADPRATIPAAVYLSEVQAAMANLGLSKVSEIRLIHVHQDHVSRVPTIVANSGVKADRVVIPSPFLGANRAIRQIVSELQSTTDTGLVARGFGSGWTPGTTIRDRGAGDVLFFRYTLGELVVEQVALRSALGRVAANPDLASYLTKVTRTADRASVVVLGDLRGRDLEAIRGAMEAQRPGSWNEFFIGVTTSSGFSHHAGRLDERDIPGMMSLLDATMLRQGRLRVVEQTSLATHGRARSDTLELMRRLGVETAVAQLPATAGPSGAGATRETLYGRGPAATRLAEIPSELTTGMGRLARLAQARATIETWRPWFVEVGGQKAEQFINDLLPEIDRSAETLRQSLRAATEAAVRVRTGGAVATTGARDYTAAGGARGTAFQGALSAIPQTTAAETTISAKGFANLESLRSTPASEIPLRVAVHAAVVRGEYSEKAFAHMLSELEPSRRSELISGPRGGRSPQVVAFARVRAEFAFRRAVLPTGEWSMPSSWSGGARFGAAAVNWLVLGVELWNAVGQPLVEARRKSRQVFTGRNLLPFVRRLLFWGQMGVRPKVVGVVDPTFGSPDYEKDFDKVIAGLQTGRWDAIYFEPPGLTDVDVMRLGIWLSYHVRNLDEYSLLFDDSAQDAVIWTTSADGSWETARWKVRVGRYETSGSNRVEESWEDHPTLTRLMNTYVRRIIANTKTILTEVGQRGAIRAETEARFGRLEFVSSTRPQYRASLREKATSTEVWVPPQGKIGVLSSSAPPRLKRTAEWSTPPVFYVYQTSGDFVEVSGADFNTYATLRGLESERHTLVIAGGTIGADEVSIIGNESGKAWLRKDLLTPSGTGK